MVPAEGAWEDPLAPQPGHQGDAAPQNASCRGGECGGEISVHALVLLETREVGLDQVDSGGIYSECWELNSFM